MRTRSYSFRHLIGTVEQYDTDVALLKVEGYAFDAVLELYELVGAHIVEAVNVGYAVAYFKDGSYFFERHL